ncbi:MAG: hypothetical protein WCP28_18555, partial [Actinomycetes bacterium]
MGWPGTIVLTPEELFTAPPTPGLGFTTETVLQASDAPLDAWFVEALASKQFLSPSVTSLPSTPAAPPCRSRRPALPAAIVPSPAWSAPTFPKLDGRVTDA